jgi:hypothetical protein
MRRLLGPVAMLALTLCFFWKLAFTDQYVWFDQPDMAYLEIPRLQFQASEIHRGQFPLWDPRIWVGQPLIGQTQPGLLYPFTLLFALLPLSDGYLRIASLNWYWVFIHFQAALFCYWLGRDLGRSRMASIIGGCLFSFGGIIGTVAWLDVVNGAIWTPLVALLLWRSIRAGGSVAYAILGGFVLGIAWLSGHHEMPLLVSYLCLFTWLWQFLRHGGRAPDWNMARAAVAFFVLVALIGAVQMLPTFEFGRISQRWLGLENTVGWKDPIPYIAQTTYSMPVRGILGLALFGVNQADSSMFFGAAGLGLALLGIVAGWRNHIVVRWTAVVAGISLLYALGAASPLQGMFYTFAPMMGKARVPIRAVHLVHFALALLAIYGVDWLADRVNPWVRRVALGWLAFGGVIAGISLAQMVLASGELDQRVLLSGWVTIALGALVFAYRAEALTRNALVGAMLALLLTELTAGLQYPNRFEKDKNKFVNALAEHRDVAKFLKSQPWPSRSAVNDTDVPMNFGDWHGVDMLQGYVAGVTENLLRHGLHTPETQRLFAVNYWVSTKPDRPGQDVLFEGEGGLKVYRNPGAMPRAWAVHGGTRVNSDGELRVAVADAAFDPWRTVLMLNAEVPNLETCDPAPGPETNEVRITRHHSNRISMRAEMRCRGMVIVADTFYPGWQAIVDGKTVPILETYGALRGVVVERGGHNIEMRFKPWTVFVGAGLFGLGLVLTAAAWRRRPKRAMLV